MIKDMQAFLLIPYKTMEDAWSTDDYSFAN